MDYRPVEYWNERGIWYEPNESMHGEFRDLGSFLFDLHEPVILESGSGNGRLYRIIQELGLYFNDYYMCDISEVLANKCKWKTGRSVVVWDGHQLPFEDRLFDVVLLWNVLLHVPFDWIEQSVMEHCRVSKRFIYVSTADLPPNHSNGYHCFGHDYANLFNQFGFKVLISKKYGAKIHYVFERQYAV